MEKTVTVIVPVYNGGLTIEETVRSLLEQTYPNFEVIIVNDGSTDDSEKIIKGINNPRIKYFTQKNTGSPAAPRNFAIKKAKGEFIAFCDQDDLWESDKLTKQLEAYGKSANKERVGIICSQAELVDENGNKIGENTPSFNGYLGPKVAFGALLNSNFITACSAIVPKKIIDESGLLDEELVGNDEFDLWLRITQKYGVLVVPERLCKLRKRAGALSERVSKIYLENEKIFKKLDAKDEAVTRGHARNLARVFTYSILEGNFEQAREFLDKIPEVQRSLKLKTIITIFKINKKLTQVLLSSLKRYNRL